MVIRLLLLGLFCLIPSGVGAIPPDTDLDDLHFDNWGTGSGLPHNAVRSVVQSRDHSLWIGTNGGVVRFDGSSMQDHTPARPRNFSSYYYRLISETGDGRLWVYSDVAGLWSVDRISGGATMIQLPGEEANSIRVVPFDVGDGRLMFANRTKVFYLDGDQVSSGLAPQPIDALVPDPVGRVVLSSAGRLSYLDGDQWVEFADLAEGGEFRAHYLAFVSDRELWAACIKNGLVHWKDGVITRYSEDNGLPDNRVRALLYDRDGSLWIGSFAGMVRWKGGAFEPVRGISTYSQDIVFSIAEDLSGNLWVGTNVGLFRIRERPTRVLTVAEGLAGNDTRDLTADHMGNLWVVSYGGGVTRVSPDGTIDRFGLEHGLSSRQLLSVAVDVHGRLHVGSEDGLFRFEGDGFRNIHPLAESELTGIRRMRSSPDGAFSVLSSKGVLRLKGDHANWLGFDQIGMPHEPSDFVTDLHGRLWIGTKFDGIYIWDEGVLTRLFDSLTDRQIRALHLDPSGRVWIGTSNGIGVFDDPDGELPVAEVYAPGGFHPNPQMRVLEPEPRLRQFTVKDGLPHSEFNTLLDTGDGFIWTAANFAVQRIHVPTLLGMDDVERIEPVVFDYRDGLPNGRFTEISPGGMIADGRGRIWTANQIGIAGIKRVHRTPNLTLPPVVFESMRVNGELFPMTEGVVLPPATGNVAFAFSAADIDPSRSLHMQARLIGLDTQWLHTTGSAFFSNLRGGSYVLQIRLSCNRAPDKSQITEYAFRVRPRFRETSAFFLGVPGVLLPLIALTVFNAQRRVRRREDQLKRLVAQRTADYQQEARRAEEASRAKTAFLANMSHEIRTPMNGVLGMAQVMRGTHLDPVQLDCLETIERSGSYLLEILNDLLDLAKIEAGAIELNVVPFLLRDLLHGIERLMQPLAAGKDLNLSIVIDDAVPSAFRGDSARIQQILLNLLNNAVKFTEKGHVELRVRLLDLPPRGLATVQFSVCDTGIGIPADKHAQIFQPFYQADSTISRKFGGTGLGLSICKLLCQKMHGQIWFEENQPQGTCFHFTLKLQVEDEQVVQHAISTACKVQDPTVDGEPLRILVAEDNPVNRKVAHLLLGRLGFTADSAKDGHEVLEAMKRKAYHLILMDIQMPNMDGLEATRLIFERYPEPSRPVIVPMTAHILQPELEAFAAAGMFRHIGKPVKLDALAQLLQTVMEMRRPRVPHQSSR